MSREGCLPQSSDNRVKAYGSTHREAARSHPADPAAAQAAGPVLGALNRFWRALCLVALWSNAVYVAGLLVTVGVLVGLGAAPWRAYANVLAVLSIAAAAPWLNVKAARTGLRVIPSALAVALNLACLGYLLFRPEYSIPALTFFVVLVPVLNIVVVVFKGVSVVRQGHVEVK